MATTYTPLATQTLASATATLSFTNISSAYTDLVLVVASRATWQTYPILKLQFNSDAGANYSYKWLGSASPTGANPTGGVASSVSLAYPGPGLAGGMTDLPEAFSCAEIHINNYANTNMWKTIVSYDGNPPNFLAATSGSTELMINTWRSTAAISSIQIGTNNGATYAAGSMFTLYGIKGA